jgi:hypothetical protein
MIGTVSLTIAGVFLLLVLVYYMQLLRGFPGFGSLDEPFSDFITNYGYPTTQLCKPPLTTPIPLLSGPGDATLNEPRVPYNLLKDHLSAGAGRLANLPSEYAYYVDGQKQIEKTGSYGQVTNNYRHKMPDNGTTWLHELTIGFYKNPDFE